MIRPYESDLIEKRGQSKARCQKCVGKKVEMQIREYTLMKRCHKITRPA